MAKDVEELCDIFDEIFKTKLNPEIVKINTDKNDGITLAQIQPEAVIFQSLNDETLNWSPFVLYGITSESSKGAGINEASDINFFVIIALSSTNLPDLPKRLLRYSKALKKIVLKRFDDLKVELIQTGPITFQNSNSSNMSHGIGLEFSISAAFDN